MNHKAKRSLVQGSVERENTYERIISVVVVSIVLKRPESIFYNIAANPDICMALPFLLFNIFTGGKIR